jgi:hypothetical protein
VAAGAFILAARQRSSRAALSASNDGACGTGVRKLAREYFTAFVVALTRSSEPLLKQVMIDEFRKGAGALALTVAENPRHCDLRDWEAAEKGKREVPIEKGFGVVACI